MNAINTTIATQTNAAGITAAATVKGMVNGLVAMASCLKRKWHSLHAWFSTERSSLLGDLSDGVSTVGLYLQGVPVSLRPVVAVIPQYQRPVVSRRHAVEQRQTGHRLLSLS